VQSKSVKVTHCRSCGSSDLFNFLDLGRSPIANKILPLVDGLAQDHKFPLDVTFCRACSLVQLAHDMPADAIFTTDYPYYSSFSDSVCRSAKQHTDALIASRGLNSQSFVVEVASNDGYLLRNLKDAGIRVLGVEPSPGPARAAVEAGVPTEVVFFGCDTARDLVTRHGLADVIIANNVMAHVPDLNDFVGGFTILLADDGVLTVENPSVLELIQKVEFDTIYHEHYCYYSCMAVDVLMRRNGLFLNDVEFLPNMHGGTLRWFIGKKPAPTSRLLERLRAERTNGVGNEAYYASFGTTVKRACAELKTLLLDLKGKGHRIAAYGAAAKGCTLLNTLGIGTDVIDYVVDKNVHKQNHLMPGAHLPIVDPKRLYEDPVDYLLLLAWNYKDEIRSQQAAFAERGGRFIVPLPHPVVL
jgi:SAM-dependent methyltransferase